MAFGVCFFFVEIYKFIIQEVDKILGQSANKWFEFGFI